MASQPHSASRSDSGHPQSRHILLSTPRTIAVASQQASHHRGGRATVGHHRTATSARGQLCSDHLRPNRQRKGIRGHSLVLAGSCAGFASIVAYGNAPAFVGQGPPLGREFVTTPLLIVSPPVASTCRQGTYRPLRKAVEDRVRPAWSLSARAVAPVRALGSRDVVAVKT